MESRPPLPPFSFETAKVKVQAAEDAWNTRNPEKVALAYTEDSEWRNRVEFFSGREEITAFLRRKWAKELDYRLKKSYGASLMIVLQCVLNTNGMTIRDSGIAPTVMKCGSLPTMV